MVDPATSPDPAPLPPSANWGRLSTAITRIRIMLAVFVFILGLALFLTLYTMTRRTRFPLAAAKPDAAPALPSTPTTRRGPIRTFEDRFGTEHVVYLVLSNPGRVRNVKETVDAKAPKLIDSSQRAWECSGRGGQFTVKLAPVDNVEELTKRIDFGTITKTDLPYRRVYVKVDPAKFVLP
jgi:hypothetical protein